MLLSLCKLNPNINLIKIMQFHQNRDVYRVNQACHSKHIKFNLPMNAKIYKYYQGAGLLAF